MHDTISNGLIPQSSNSNGDYKLAHFSLEGYMRFGELPLAVLNALPYSVYIIDYSWTYLFLNDHSKAVFKGDLPDLSGKSALEVFRGQKFHQIFDRIRDGVEKKFTTINTVYSPLRGE